MRINCSKIMKKQQIENDMDILYALRREYIQDIEACSDDYVEACLYLELQKVESDLEELYNELINLGYED
jgi:hypothetical protein